MRIRRRFVTYADIYEITYHKLAVVNGNQTLPRRNYLTMLAAAGSNTNLNISVLWAEGRSEGYTELECECNH